jgi:hypothetical protein
MNAGYNINLSCPPSESATQGHSFDCLVGAGTVIKVTVTDDQGNYTFAPVGANTGTGPPSWTTSAPAPPTSAPAAPPLPVNSSHLLAGTAHPTFGVGKPGKLDVVYVGPIDRSESGDTLIPIALRNNTSKAVSHVDVSAALSVGGKIAATGTSQEVQPAQLAPGEVGLSYIYFQIGTSVPAHPTYAFTFETMPADSSSYNTASAKVTQANRSGGQIVGAAINTTGKTLQGPYKVDVFCFDGANKLVDVGGAFTDQNGNIAPSGNLTFTADLYGTTCPRYLVGVTGYYA